ncbi:hypothetical protein IFR05_008421 [Cadophora sp. M221]|nr:hypothetical protein IFR05_008421 [Cadophora sp. M221]
MPVTFKDAITMTRNLGFQYVWIDALCILQDDHDDWIREAAKMGSYYGHSVLTIAAGDASCSEDGFLKPRDPAAAEAAPLGTYSFPGQIERDLYIQECNTDYWVGRHLDQRGWTLQERILSPRTIHYTNKGMFWECRELLVHEKGGSQLVSTVIKGLSLRPWANTEKVDDLPRLWRRLLGNYTSRKLTMADDKLPAISGLATMFHRLHGGEYLAGIWKHELPSGLLWRRSFRQYAPLVLSQSYRAPSWSWASLDGEIQWAGMNDTQIVEEAARAKFCVLEATVAETIKGSFSHVTSGYLLVAGILERGYYYSDWQGVASGSNEQDLLVPDEKRRTGPLSSSFIDESSSSSFYHVYSHYPEPYIRIFSTVHRLMKFDFESYIVPESVGHPFEMAKLVELRSVVWDDDMNWETERLRSPNVSTLSTFTGVSDPAKIYLPIKDVAIPIVGKETIPTLKMLLGDCYTYHNYCPKPGISTLPSRVIDIGQEEKSLVRLHVTQTHEKAEYLALSYIWGGPQEIATTIATLPEWKHGIPVDTLPLTLQDAITVTRQLGFRYLWVDALCIIQDDAADKAAEINRMGTIYKNSTLTIAAASTRSVQESFLSPKPIPAAWSVPYLLPNGTFGNLWMKAHTSNLVSSPLDTRAWALQESLLSPRVLWYGPVGLKWKCQTTEFRDVHETLAPYGMYLKRKHTRLPSSVFGIAEPDSTLDFRSRQQSAIWKNVVEDYSGRDLTFPEDRLPALAGIASELQKLWRDDYLAGMWRSCIVKHLAWRGKDEDVSPSAEDDLSTLHLPLEYQSPGWSWISYRGEVDILDVFDEHAQLMGCSVTLVDSTAPISRVRNGTLVLKAACISEEQRLKTNFNDCWFKWDYNQCCEQKGINKDFRYALLGYKEQQTHQKESGEREGVALVIAPVADGTFMRIGTMQGFSTEDWPVEALERQVITII